MVSGAQSEILQGRGDYVELGHFDKSFVKSARKTRRRRENFWSFLSQVLLKLHFLMEDLTQEWTNLAPLFPKSGHFFGFLKRAGEASSSIPFPTLPSCASGFLFTYARQGAFEDKKSLIYLSIYYSEEQSSPQKI